MSRRKGGRKSKYHTHIKPRLAEIEAWARDGLTDEQIAKNLNVGVSTFHKYKNEYIELVESLKKGKEIVDVEVENAMLKRALGYEYEEVRTLIEEVDGKKKKKVEKVIKHVPADVTAGIFWLRNRKGNAWSNKEEIDIKKSLAEIKKLEAEADKLAKENKVDSPPTINIIPLERKSK